MDKVLTGEPVDQPVSYQRNSVMGSCYAPSHLPSSGQASDLARSLLQSSGLARFGPLSPALLFLLIRSYPRS